jgi:hypothetical protein
MGAPGAFQSTNTGFMTETEDLDALVFASKTPVPTVNDLLGCSQR